MIRFKFPIFLLTSLLITIYCESLDSSGLFYIHELDDYFSWPFVNPNVTNKNCKTKFFNPSQFDNAGYGRLIDPKQGLFYTWHYSLYSHILNRMLRSKRRTRNPDEASLFLIPIDMNWESSYETYSCKTRNNGCNMRKMRFVINYLSHNEHFKKNHGRDHLLIWNLINSFPDPQHGCSRFLDGICKHCLSTSSWMSPIHDKIKPVRFFQMPSPSNFHYPSKEDRLKLNIPARPYPWENTEAQNKKRIHLATYIGGRYAQAPHLRRIKSAIAEFCTRDKDCNIHEFGHAEWSKEVDAKIGRRLSNTLNNNNKTINLRGNEGITYNHKNLMVYAESVFCLMPPGDHPGFRRGHFDALYLGCIPVTFHEHTLVLPYQLQVNETELMAGHVAIAPETLFKSRVGSNEASAFVKDDRSTFKEHDLMKKIDYSDLDDTPGNRFMDTLRKLAKNPEVIKAYQRGVAYMAPRLMYAMPPIESIKKQDAAMNNNRKIQYRRKYSIKHRPQPNINAAQRNIISANYRRSNNNNNKNNNNNNNNNNRQLQQKQQFMGNSKKRQHRMEQITMRKVNTWDPEFKDAVDYMLDHIMGFLKKEWEPLTWADHPLGKKFYKERLAAEKKHSAELKKLQEEARKNGEPIPGMIRGKGKARGKRRPGEHQRQRQQNVIVGANINMKAKKRPGVFRENIN